MNNNTKSKKSISLSNGILILGAISTVAAYCALPGTGIVSSLPLLAICAAICAFIPTSNGVKLAMLPIMTCVFATVITGKTMHAIYMALLCFLLCICGIYAKKLLDNKKILLKLCAIVLLCAMLAVNLYFCGSVVDAINSDRILTEYFDTHYAETVEHSGCYYDHTSGVYRLDLNSAAAPTIKRALYIQGGVIYDGYKPRAEAILTVLPVSLISSTLRQQFPSDSFGVTDAEIVGFSPDKIDPSTQAVHSELMRFTVHIDGTLTKQEFFAKAKEYAFTLQFSNAGYDSITYVGGNGMTDIYQLTVRKGLIYLDVTESDIVPCKGIISKIIK